MDNYSHAGYVAWFGLIEIICKENKYNVTGDLEISPVYLKRKLRISTAKLKQIFGFCQTKGKLSFNISQEKWNFKFSKVADLKDNYTKNLQATSKKVSLEVEEDKKKKEKKKDTQIKEEDKNEIIYIVFDFWNSQGITKHKTVDKMKASINAAIKDYSVEEIQKAIMNYNTILNDPTYYWTHKWTLKEFLQRGMDKFRDENNPFANYKAKDSKSKTAGNWDLLKQTQEEQNDRSGENRISGNIDWLG